MLLVSLATSLWATPAPATPVGGACGRLVPCGQYRGPSTQNFADGVNSREFETTLDVGEPAPGQIRIVETVRGEEVKTWTLDLNLAADDSFEVSQVDGAQSRVIGRGRCVPNACFAKLNPEFGSAGFSLNTDQRAISFVVNQRYADGRAFTRLFRVDAPAASPAAPSARRRP